MKRKKLFALVALLTLAGCTDSQMSNLYALGDPGHVQCFSGGVLIYEGSSTGKIHATQNSDGWEFREKGSNDFVRVSGHCIVRHNL